MSVRSRRSRYVQAHSAAAPRREVVFFGVCAVALALLGADDALQIHENVLPDQLGVPQKLVYVVYLGAAALWAWT